MPDAAEVDLLVLELGDRDDFRKAVEPFEERVFDRLAEALRSSRNRAGGRSWLRKNTTQLSSQMRRISATVASSRSRARSTPAISAPSEPAIL
jgi:hypothetical protein